jgi:hypothetical protein
MVAVVLDVETDARDGEPHRNPEDDGEPDVVREQEKSEVGADEPSQHDGRLGPEPKVALARRARSSKMLRDTLL